MTQEQINELYAKYKPGVTVPIVGSTTTPTTTTFPTTSTTPTVAPVVAPTTTPTTPTTPVVQPAVAPVTAPVVQTTATPTPAPTTQTTPISTTKNMATTNISGYNAYWGGDQYTGPTLSGFMSFTGMADGVSARKALASQYGITNYTGTADQDLKILRAIYGSDYTPYNQTYLDKTGRSRAGSLEIMFENSGDLTKTNQLRAVENDPVALEALMASWGYGNTPEGSLKFAQDYTRFKSGYTPTPISEMPAFGLASGPTQSQLETQAQTTGVPAPTSAPSTGTTGQYSLDTTTGIRTDLTSGQQMQIDATGKAIPITPTAPTGTTPTQPTSGYTGPSVVDYLSSIGQDSSFSSRLKLAQSMGIPSYTGTAQQNTELLSKLRAQATQTTGTQTTTTGGQTTPTGGVSGTTGASTGTFNLTTGNLQSGSAGTNVSQLQTLLNQFGANLSVDGKFGPLTKQAVMEFQAANGLEVDGIVGPKTMAKLNELAGQKQDQTKTAVNNALSNAGVDTSTITTPDGKTSTVVEEAFQTDPIGTFQDVIQTMYDSAGLDTIKAEIDKTIEAKSDLENELNDKITEISNNPWLSESLKSKKIESLQNNYQGKLQILIDTLDLQGGMYDKAIEDIRWTATTALDQYNANRTFDENQKQSAFDNAIKMAQLQLDQYKASQPDTGGSGGLTPAQINSTVNSIAGAFDNEPIVKNYNTAQEGYQTLQSIGVNTSNPADDIAFIYAFAKIMDPNSVVREGEYNTVQKYAQTWADNFGFKAQRVFSNTNFLSSDAKQKMLNALTPKINTLTTQYDNLYSEYQRQIQDAYAGQPRQITDYSRAFTTQNENTQNETSDFSDIANSLTINEAKKEVYIPRAVWSTLGARMDALITDVASDGYKLLVN